MSSRTALHSLYLPAVVVGLAFTSRLFAQNQTPQSTQAPPPQSPAATVGIAPGQTPTPQLAGAPTIRVTAREVLLDVLVVDKSGQPVTGLKASDFSVSEARTGAGHPAVERASRDDCGRDEQAGVSAGTAAQHLFQLHAGAQYQRVHRAAARRHGFADSGADGDAPTAHQIF